MVRVLFVCMGNICRSPTAHGVFRKLVDEAGLAHAVEVDSAGTHAYHVGKAPDQRAQTTARRRGIPMEDLRARHVRVEDFGYYDYILAMDKDNLSDLLAIAPSEHAHKVRLFMELAPDWGAEEVPDPYYGGSSGFERVLDMVEVAAAGLIEEIRQNR